MKKRTRTIIKIFLAAVVVCVLLIAVLYSRIALRPSPIAPMEAKVVAGLNALKGARLAPVAAPAMTQEKTAEKILEADAPPRDSSADLLFEAMTGGSYTFSLDPGAQAALSNSVLREHLDPLNHALPSIRMNVCSKPTAHSIMSAPEDGGAAGGNRAWLNDELDRIETLTPGTLAGLEEGYAYVDRSREETKIKLCVLRAVVRGDEAKALAMLENWRAYRNATDIGFFSQRYGNRRLMLHESALPFLFALGEIKDCPQTVFERVTKIIHESEPDEKEIQTRRTEWLISIRDSVYKTVSHGDGVHNQNALHYINSGRLEGWMRDVMKPVYTSQLDEFIAAFDRGDAAGAQSARASLNRTSAMMNLSGKQVEEQFNALFGHDAFTVESRLAAAVNADFLAGAREDQQTARVVIAYSLHRSRDGVWPASVADLTDEEKRIASLEKMNTETYTGKLPAFSGPALHHASQEFWWAVTKFSEQSGRNFEPTGLEDPPISATRGLPENAQELKNYLNERKTENIPSEADWRFDDYPERPLFMLSRKLGEKDFRKVSEILPMEWPRATVLYPDPTLDDAFWRWLFASERRSPERRDTE